MEENKESKKPELIAYVVEDGKDKGYWSRVGAAWKNKAGGFNLNLTALPVGGKLVLIPPKEDKES